MLEKHDLQHLIFPPVLFIILQAVGPERAVLPTTVFVLVSGSIGSKIFGVPGL